jgi:hypothetical protein
MLLCYKYLSNYEFREIILTLCSLLIYVEYLQSSPISRTHYKESTLQHLYAQLKVTVPVRSPGISYLSQKPCNSTNLLSK